MKVAGKEDNHEETVVGNESFQKLHDQKVEHWLKSGWFLRQVSVHDDSHGCETWVQEAMPCDKESQKHGGFLMILLSAMLYVSLKRIIS